MLKADRIIKVYKSKGIGFKNNPFVALDDITLEIEGDKTYALVGESGCGKSTLTRILAYIEKPTKGTIYLKNRPIEEYTAEELRKKRSIVQLIMQDALSSLDPRQNIERLIEEPMKNLLTIGKQQRKNRVKKLMEIVELSESVLKRLPHEISGGQQKRVCIARALSVKPALIIFDEAFSGLDVTVRLQILDLLKRIKEELKCSYLIVTHDLDIAMYMSRNIMVMKDGKIIESIKDINSFLDFKTPYAITLINALHVKQNAFKIISKEI